VLHQGGLHLFGERLAAAQRGVFDLGRDRVHRFHDHPGVRRVDLPGGQRIGARREDRRQRLTGQPAPRPEIPGGPDPGGGFAGGDAQQLAEQAGSVAGAEFGAEVPLIHFAHQPGVYRGEPAQLGVDSGQQAEQLVAAVAGYRRGEQVVDRGAERRRDVLPVLIHHLNIVHTC
jgi:hypothetical protein